jgi:hypothetical protein
MFGKMNDCRQSVTLSPRSFERHANVHSPISLSFQFVMEKVVNYFKEINILCVLFYFTFFDIFIKILN